MNSFVYCFNREKIGKGIGQARAVAVCRHIECKHITELNECLFQSAEEKKILAAAKIASEKKAEKAEDKNVAE
jgi:hypothetical protein